VSCEGDRKGEGSFITSWVGGGSRIGARGSEAEFICVCCGVGREQRPATAMRGEEKREGC
jgi:hypothetical protein